jgi:SET domain-containing protein
MATTNGKAGKPGKNGKSIKMKESKIHGRGVFAARGIPAGKRIVEYKGERITWKQADQRYPDDPDAPSHTFLFSVGELVTDANRKGNVARWINHSCDPNCEAVEDDERIFIEAIRDIMPGEELSYEYNIIFDERHTKALKQRYTCRCGHKGCRGTLLGDKK